MVPSFSGQKLDFNSWARNHMYDAIAPDFVSGFMWDRHKFIPMAQLCTENASLAGMGYIVSKMGRGMRSYLMACRRISRSKPIQNILQYTGALCQGKGGTRSFSWPSNVLTKYNRPGRLRSRTIALGANPLDTMDKIDCLVTKKRTVRVKLVNHTLYPILRDALLPTVGTMKIHAD